MKYMMRIEPDPGCAGVLNELGLWPLRSYPESNSGQAVLEALEVMAARGIAPMSWLDRQHEIQSAPHLLVNPKAALEAEAIVRDAVEREGSRLVRFEDWGGASMCISKDELGLLPYAQGQSAPCGKRGVLRGDTGGRIVQLYEDRSLRRLFEFTQKAADHIYAAPAWVRTVYELGFSFYLVSEQFGAQWALLVGDSAGLPWPELDVELNAIIRGQELISAWE